MNTIAHNANTMKSQNHISSEKSHQVQELSPVVEQASITARKRIAWARPSNRHARSVVCLYGNITTRSTFGAKMNKESFVAVETVS